MRIVRTSFEMEAVCGACASKIALVPKDVKMDMAEPYFLCPVCGVMSGLTDRIPPKWEDFLRARNIRER